MGSPTVEDGFPGVISFGGKGRQNSSIDGGVVGAGKARIAAFLLRMELKAVRLRMRCLRIMFSIKTTLIAGVSLARR